MSITLIKENSRIINKNEIVNKVNLAIIFLLILQNLILKFKEDYNNKEIYVK